MKRREFLLALGACSVFLAGPETLPFSRSGRKTEKSPGLEKKTNIILINVDDLGWADLSCYGSSYHETKHIDSLAAQGMRFTDAYAASAVCSPTRASILTGRYPARIGITDWIHHLNRAAHTAIGRGKNPVAYVGSSDQALLCPPNSYWMELEEVTIAEVLKKGPLKREAIFWHFPHYRGEVVPYSIIRKGHMKLIRRYEGRRFELFNLREDIGEKKDLSDRMPEKVRELDGLLRAWLEETGARLPVENPDYRKDSEKRR